MFTRNQITAGYLAVMSALMFAGFHLGIREYQITSLTILWIFSIIGIALYIKPIHDFLIGKNRMIFPVGNALILDAVIAAVVLIAGYWVLAIAYSIAACRIYLPAKTK